MELLDRREIIENLKYLVQAQDRPKLKNILIDIHPADIADIIRDMEIDERAFIFNLLDLETRSDVVLELDEVTRDQLIEVLGPEELSQLVDQMDSDDATDVLSDLPEETAKKVLARLDFKDRAEVEKLIVHDEETAGGIMALEFVAVYTHETVDDAIQKIRQKAQEVEEIYNVYAIDEKNQLAGVVPLKRLLLAKHNQLIRDIMNSDVIAVTLEKDQEEVARMFRRYDLVSIPVVDHENRLVGRITIDDIVDVLHEEANEDMHRMAGIADEEIPQEMSTLRISRFRLPWLLVSFVGEIFSAFIMRSFEATINQIVATAFFIPLIMAMGGNTGIQASTIVVRSIALEEGGTTNRWSRLWREIRVAGMNGLIMGILITTMVIIFFTDDPFFGMVVGTSMFFVMLNAAIVGAVVPYVLHRFNFDPAIATGPFITTSNDVLGLFIYLSFTVGYLRWLS
ncbi:magnesium transporter [candidate division KSB1 bacterium]|jgi:magnesium transporter|nr:magnesium transporter [candidate division KSB1 bacterium]